MPKSKINYDTTIIYKIVCKDLAITNIYIGHTTNFIKRKCSHKYFCNKLDNSHYNLLLYQTIRKNGGWNNWSMIEVETFSCKNKREAELRERYWIENLNADLNIYIPNRTQQEREQTESRKLYQKNYREKNKDKIKEYMKEYFKKKYNIA